MLFWQQPWADRAPAPKPAISADAASTIARQIGALDAATTKKEFLSAAGNSATARAWATQTYANMTKLAATDISWRFVSGGEPDIRTDGATEATVDVSWRPGAPSGLVQATTRESTVTFVLDSLKGGSFAVREVVRAGGSLPLWLAGALDVHQHGGATVISIDGGNPDQPIAQYATRARAVVGKVVKDTTSPLVVVSPHTQSQAAAVLNEPQTQIDQIAAVTTTLDGSARATSADVIVLNPAVFATMDARAAQIVMSHEATHVITGAADANLDSWVSEGFADYVALRDDKAPLAVSAGQILKTVKAGGAPTHLPTAADFGATAYGLGGVYESAWMAFRMLAAEYGEAAVLAFYDDTLRGEETEKASRSAFGLSIAELTAQWRHYLTKSASITS